MLIEETRPEGQAAVTAYAPGRIEIDGQVYTQAVVLAGGRIGSPAQTDPASLTAEDFFQTASEYGGLPEVVLVGTGEKQVFLHPKTAARLVAEGVGLECMSTASACRTFMILQSEGRKVWAWLWP
ncbi:Mth938-like domain-containing protein [Neisseria dentiae]|uniref:Mth938-like domain-containing protein n=1 Tax=Neisseria dentiae TaxID=194197 RepID=UPI00211D0EBE|nr:Mth938-like domain-containing protein [Neisseria dentiae]MCQ9326971.1 Mth938-like domain-containing protein [Neisseria dentiae]